MHSLSDILKIIISTDRSCGPCTPDMSETCQQMEFPQTIFWRICLGFLKMFSIVARFEFFNGFNNYLQLSLLSILGIQNSFSDGDFVLRFLSSLPTRGCVSHASKSKLVCKISLLTRNLFSSSIRIVFVLSFCDLALNFSTFSHFRSCHSSGGFILIFSKANR